jgi:hypothetical protein
MKRRASIRRAVRILLFPLWSGCVRAQCLAISSRISTALRLSSGGIIWSKVQFVAPGSTQPAVQRAPGLFSEGKSGRSRGVDHPPLHIAEVKGRVELYLPSLGLHELFTVKFTS